MYDEIVSRQEIDTRNAQIIMKASKDWAIQFYRKYSKDYSMKRVNQQLRGSYTGVIRGNCQNEYFLTCKEGGIYF
jgi:hypothetical protein